MNKTNMDGEIYDLHFRRLSANSEGVVVDITPDWVISLHRSTDTSITPSKIEYPISGQLKAASSSDRSIISSSNTFAVLNK